MCASIICSTISRRSCFSSHEDRPRRPARSGKGGLIEEPGTGGVWADRHKENLKYNERRVIQVMDMLRQRPGCNFLELELERHGPKRHAGGRCGSRWQGL